MEYKINEVAKHEPEKMEYKINVVRPEPRLKRLGTETATARGYFSIAVLAGEIIAFGRTIEDCVKNSMQALKDETVNLTYVEITDDAFFDIVFEGKQVGSAIRTPGISSKCRDTTFEIKNGIMKMVSL